MTERYHLLLWIIWAAVLGGCSSVLTSDQPADRVYWLESVTLQPHAAPIEQPPDLVVAMRSVPGLDTDRILVKGPGARLNHYAGASWPDHSSEVMAALVQQSLESSGRFNRISNGSAVRGDDWALELQLREFFAVVTATETAPTIHVKLAGHLSCGPGNTAVSASATAPAGQNKLADIVAAFQQATDDVMIDLGRQLETACMQITVP
jgi:ABC-type uncharacterized transport system auxiliary subunit